MSLRIKEIADTVQNSSSPILCLSVGLRSIHMTRIFVYETSRVFGRNQLKTVYGYFLEQNLRNCHMCGAAESPHRKS